MIPKRSVSSGHVVDSGGRPSSADVFCLWGSVRMIFA